MASSAAILPKEQRQALYLEKFKKLPYPHEAAQLVGIPIRTLNEWKIKDERFRLAFEEIRQNFIGGMVDKAERNVLEVAQEPRQAWLAVRVLEQFHPEWRRNDNGGPITVNVVGAIMNPHAGETTVPTESGPINDPGVNTGIPIEETGYAETTGEDGETGPDEWGGGVAGQGGGG